MDPPTASSSSGAQADPPKAKGLHRPLKGYEVCVHTCVPKGCPSQATQTILWRREGHSCRKHACKATLHPHCGVGENAGCPGLQCLGSKSHEFGSRPPTDAELTVVNDIPVLVHPGDSTSKPVGSRDDSPVDLERDMAGSIAFKYPSQPSFVRPFQLIFIPDPTLELKSKAAAINDLAFVHTYLTEPEHTSMKHLEGSIHSMGIATKVSGRGPPKYKVCMQEWVGVDFSLGYLANIDTQIMSTVVYDDFIWSLA